MTIQFGILLDDARIQRWQQGCLQRLTALPDVRAAVVVYVGDGPDGAPSATHGSAAHGAPSAAQGATHDSAAHGAPSPTHGPAAADAHGPSPDEQVALPAGIAALPSLRIGGVASASATDAREVERHGLDFILSFVSAACPPSLLHSARWGVWRYQFGDWSRLRGGPVGFWEVYAGHPESAVLLVRVTSDPDAVIVLREGYVRTAAQSPAKNRAQLLRSAGHFAAQVCMELQHGAADRLSAPPLRSVVPARSNPTPLQQLVCAGRVLGRMVAEAYRGLFSHTQWNVGIVEQPISSFVTGERRAPVRWLPSPKRSEFRADPFGFMRDGRLTILLEDFSYVSNRGTISAMEPDSAVTLPVTIGPQPPVHLSYPYLIEVDGRPLCIPEAHEASEVALYEVTRFPDRWERVATFPISTVIVDATLFHHEGRWWIAGSEPGSKGASSELHLWYAPAIGGPWLAHPANPVKIDIRSARPAGTPFYHNGALYRPAQDCSKSYGGRVCINQVTMLSPTAFREVVVATVEPYDPYREGIHTLSRVGNVTLIDGKRSLFVPEEFRRNARHFLRKALGLSSKSAAGAPPVAE